MEMTYSYILAVTPLRNGTTTSLLTWIAGALLTVETAAYLVVMWWHRNWFVSQAVANRRKKSFLRIITIRVHKWCKGAVVVECGSFYGE